MEVYLLKFKYNSTKKLVNFAQQKNINVGGGEFIELFLKWKK